VSPPVREIISIISSHFVCVTAVGVPVSILVPIAGMAEHIPFNVFPKVVGDIFSAPQAFKAWFSFIL
jgi:hypothetical protein